MQPNEDIYYQCFEINDQANNNFETCQTNDVQQNNYNLWLGIL